tara:strand:+ start:159 stop:452 length:294 start_codon:yes stop_codon:yes gene_type:complete
MSINKIVQNKPILFVLDRDRNRIYNQTLELNSYENKMYNYFSENCCSLKNHYFIDLFEVFKNHFSLNKLNFEFENDFHWNELGHKLVAEKIIKSGFL